nr:unnamed protein product [Spirometra erinaceieuropaei]
MILQNTFIKATRDHGFKCVRVWRGWFLILEKNAGQLNVLCALFTGRSRPICGSQLCYARRLRHIVATYVL